MKVEYKRFFNNGEIWLLGCGGGLAITLIPLFVILAVNTPAAGTFSVLIVSIIMVVIIVLSLAPPAASFEVNDTQVTFSYLGRKTVIEYNHIKELKLERRHNERSTKGGIQRCYVETLTIRTAERVYSYSAEMDIDYDAVAKDPALLTEQFENSKFNKLKEYIEGKMV